MFRVEQIVKVVSGQLLSRNSYLSLRGVSIDSRTIKKNELFIAIEGERFDGHNFIPQAIQRGATSIIIQNLRCKLINKKNITYIKVVNSRRALADLARFHRRRFKIPIIAITGSNGKTTTKDMLAWVMSSQAKVLKNLGTQNNDIGVPLTLLKLDNSYNMAVLELGTNHFGEISYLARIAEPNFGIITNIGPAHLEYLKNLSGVYREKISLLRWLKSPGIAILNADEPRFKRIKSDKRLFVVTYGIKKKSDFYASQIKLTPSKAVEFKVNSFSSSQCKIRLNTIGYVNIYNALAVIASCRLLGLSYEKIRNGLANFIFIPGRLRLIKLNHLSFIDDTYNANPASLSEALDVIDRFKVKGRKIFLMGDMLELGKHAEEFHRQAGKQIARVCDAFIAVGQLAGIAAQWAVKYGLSKDCVLSCQDSEEGGSLLYEVFKPDPGDIILVKGSRLTRMERVLRKG